MERVNFSYTKFTLSDKPAGFDADLQTYSKYQHVLASPQEMLKYILEGHAWRVGEYGTHKRFVKANVVSARIVGLDFDKSKFSPNEIVEYARSIGLVPNFYYWSYSQGRKLGNNFRIVWILAASLQTKEFEQVYLKFLYIFRQFKPDEATKDASRFFYGTNKGGDFIDGELLALEKLELFKTPEPRKFGRKVSNTTEAVNLDRKIQVEGDWWKLVPKYACDLWDRWVGGQYLNRNQRFKLFSNIRYLYKADGDLIGEFLALSNAKEFERNGSSGYGREELERWYRDDTVGAILIMKVGLFVEKPNYTIPQYIEEMGGNGDGTTMKK